MDVVIVTIEFSEAIVSAAGQSQSRSSPTSQVSLAGFCQELRSVSLNPTSKHIPDHNRQQNGIQDLLSIPDTLIVYKGREGLLTVDIEF